MEKEYIVVLNADVDFAQFNQEMIDNTGAGVIPNRTVDVANPRPGSQRSTHYSLTDEEAEELKNDSRVLDVVIPLKNRDDVKIILNASQSGNFQKTTSNSGTHLNWAMLRCIEKSNIYNDNYYPPPFQSNNFEYTLDGTGVDVVIIDSGIQVDHPEFDDADGVSRVQQIDWYTESGLSGTQNANHYRDYDGHGTHVAGTAAGLTYGWAKNARIYSVKMDGIEGAGDSGTGISSTDCFDVVKEWHNNKTNGRPTIVNMSIGWAANIGPDFTVITSVDYRGTTYNSGNDPRWQESITYMTETYGIHGYLRSDGNYHVPVRDSAIDTDIQEMIDAGIHVVIASGNSNFKADISGGVDYNNSSAGYYYHRGSSPYNDNAFCVGSIDSAPTNLGEQISNFSVRGPAVNIFAPGSYIRSAMSNTNEHSAATYYLNSSYKQGTISGTSMASPQVCGLAATILQLNLSLTPAQLLQKVTNLAWPNKLWGFGSYGTELDLYEHTRALLGAPNRFLYTPYNSPKVFQAYDSDGDGNPVFGGIPDE